MEFMNYLVAIAATAAVCIGYMKWDEARKSRTSVLRRILAETKQLKGTLSSEEKAIQEALIKDIQEEAAGL